MENYSKGANLEKPLELCDVPINNIPVGIVWMKVKPASKMINLIEFAVKSLEENGIQLWSGIGPAVGKTVSCVEIIKRRFGNLHQISKINYQKSVFFLNIIKLFSFIQCYLPGVKSCGNLKLTGWTR